MATRGCDACQPAGRHQRRYPPDHDNDHDNDGQPGTHIAGMGGAGARRGGGARRGRQTTQTVAGAEQTRRLKQVTGRAGWGWEGGGRAAPQKRGARLRARPRPATRLQPRGSTAKRRLACVWARLTVSWLLHAAAGIQVPPSSQPTQASWQHAQQAADADASLTASERRGSTCPAPSPRSQRASKASSQRGSDIVESRCTEQGRTCCQGLQLLLPAGWAAVMATW